MAILVLLASGVSAGDPSPDSEEKSKASILVLLSGEVLQGEVSKLDDRYLVGVESGRIFVPESNVEIVCGSLKEAYQYRRSRMGRGQVQDHAELAQWCQRQGLEAAAEEQLQIARRLDPNHPMVGLVERRLEASRVSREPKLSESEPERGPDPTPEQLEEFAAGLPAGTVESFTRTIQPLLLNRCATSGCHTERSENEFQLERPRPGVPLGRTSTHRNLLATLKLVDAEAPSQCELLKPNLCPHRIQTDATRSLSRTGQYRSLVTWVGLLTKQPLRERASRSTAAETPPKTIRSGPPKSERTANSEPETATKAAGRLPFELPKPASPPDGGSPIERKAMERQAVAPGQGQPADPFDPAIFNRRYGTAPPVPEEAPRGDKVPAPNPFFAG